MSSRWNAFLDRKHELGSSLKLEHHKLVDAIARNTLGWNKASNEIGERLLMDMSGLHGRSFTRARDDLVTLGFLIYVTPAVRGRGHRGRYELVLDSGETHAPERAIARESPAQTPAQSPAPERARRGGKGEGVNPDHKEHRSDAGKNAVAASLTGVLQPPERGRRKGDPLDQDQTEAIELLVAVIPAEHRDDNLRLTLHRSFGHLVTADGFLEAANLARRRLANDPPIPDPAAYTYRIIEDVAAGYHGDHLVTDQQTLHQNRARAAAYLEALSDLDPTNPFGLPALPPRPGDAGDENDARERPAS